MPADALVKPFNNFAYNLLAGEIDLLNDSFKMQLHTSSLVLTSAILEQWDFQDDLTYEVAAGGGYSTGGLTITNPTIAPIGNSSTNEWAAYTTYRWGELVRGSWHIYRCTVPGTSGSTTPTWPVTSGGTVTDGTVTWAECGRRHSKFTFDDVLWSNSTITAAYGVLIDVTPGGASINPLIAIWDFQGNRSSSAGNFEISISSSGALVLCSG